MISAGCYALSPLDRRRSGRRDDARERNQRADIPVSNSRRHGPLIANQAPHRHRQAKSGTCRGREPPHARHTSPAPRDEPRASTDAPSPFDPFRLLRRDRPSSALETPWRAPITGGDAGAFASRRPPLLEHRNVLVIGPRLIQGCEAVRSLTIAAAVGKRLPRKKPWGSPWTAGIKRSLSPSAPRLALRPALGLRPPFRFGAVPERPGYSPSWIAPSSERGAALVQAPPLRLGR